MKQKTVARYNPKEIEAKWPSSAKATEGQAIERYNPRLIEKKWQDAWREAGLYKFDLDSGQARMTSSKGKYYTLVELPYPSGDLHIGHWFTFIAPDVLSRFKTMQGYNVFFPMGYDAFGLPAENAAIKHGVHPKDWTEKNIETMTKQFETMGTMIDWDHVTVTCKPEYYKWNQWIFEKMYERGIAYRGKTLSNWCPTDQTVLANEHVENGKCWRCGSVVVQKEVEQWFLKITDYAEKLLWDEKGNGVDWPKSVMTAQNDWIGRSEGLQIEFNVQNADLKISVFTTRPETIDGCSFIVIAPEHKLVSTIHSKEVEDYVKASLSKLEQDRLIDAKTKTGVDTGYKAVNPVTGKLIPVYIADYVLGNYGTGAVMGVPFADERDREFAKAYNLPLIETSFKAHPEGKKVVQYHLRDWSVSRQRYWGTPVPMIDCPKDGIVPVPEKDLPVTLPYNVDYQPKGKAPLASNEEWMKVKCPKCGREALRDPETLDTFFDSSWYYYRYIDPHYEKGPFDVEKVKQLMPLDIYFGGGEHTLGHTLYARFFTKFFKDLGMVDFDEFAKKRVQHGIVLGPDGNKMSKSKGNVINPDDVVREFGTDAVRVYLSFMMPYPATGPWSTTAMYGTFRFLKRVWGLQEKISNFKSQISNGKGVTEAGGPHRVPAAIAKPSDGGGDWQDPDSGLTHEDLFQMHTTIKKVTEDIAETKNNTAVAAMMKWLNFLEAKETISTQEFTKFLLILSPFAPHITEELWQLQKLSANEAKDVVFKSIHQESWPSHDNSLIVSDMVTVAVQVNGKLRETIQVASLDIKNESKIEEIAKKSEKMQSYLVGKSVKKIIHIPGKIVNFVV